MRGVDRCPTCEKSAAFIDWFICNSSSGGVTHPVVGQRGVVVLRVELQGDKGHVSGDAGGHGLHRLVLGDIHILEDARQEQQLVCQGEGGRMFINYYVITNYLSLKQTEAAGRGQKSRRQLFFCVVFFSNKTLRIWHGSLDQRTVSSLEIHSPKRKSEFVIIDIFPVIFFLQQHGGHVSRQPSASQRKTDCEDFAWPPVSGHFAPQRKDELTRWVTAAVSCLSVAGGRKKRNFDFCNCIFFRWSITL